jgi:2'-5' RNA ligase
MPRSFIAIDFPESTANQLQDIAFGLPGAAWVPSHQYHLTLRFFKDIDDAVFEDVRHALNEVRAESFHLSLKNVGHFPLRGTPEILWAGVAQNDELSRLNYKLESALKRAGLDPEGRKFHPHVTLARLKNGALRHLGDFEVQHSLFKISDIPVEEFHLYSSRLTPEGALHTIESSYSLEGMLQGQGDEMEEMEGRDGFEGVERRERDPGESGAKAKEVA